MAFLVNLYAQHIFRDATQGRYKSIFDVETISTHRELDSVWRLATGRLSPLNTASMISIDFRTDSTFRPREGSWYQVLQQMPTPEQMPEKQSEEFAPLRNPRV